MAARVSLFKDRALLRANPYQLLEGLAVAALAVGAREAFVGIKQHFEKEGEALTRAVEEMHARELGGTSRSPSSGALTSTSPARRRPRSRSSRATPPAPPVPPLEHGLFATAPQTGWESHEPEPGHRGEHQSKPTLVNNVETLCNVPHILARGAEWHRAIGTARSPGHVVVTVVGDVVRPGVAEVELGTPLGEVIDAVGGGVAPGRRLKAVFSGVANAVVTADHLDAPLSYEGLADAGSGMGAAGFAVYDDTACMVHVAHQYSRFLWVESCGQCPPCKLARARSPSAWLPSRSAGGRTRTWASSAPACRRHRRQSLLPGHAGTAGRLQHPAGVPRGVRGPHRRRLPRPRHDLVAPKILELAHGRVTHDERHRRKRPDWTFEGEPGSGG